jgi:hypothetical protein
MQLKTSPGATQAVDDASNVRRLASIVWFLSCCACVARVSPDGLEQASPGRMPKIWMHSYSVARDSWRAASRSSQSGGCEARGGPCPEDDAANARTANVIAMALIVFPLDISDSGTSRAASRPHTRESGETQTFSPNQYRFIVTASKQPGVSNVNCQGGWFFAWIDRPSMQNPRRLVVES